MKKIIKIVLPVIIILLTVLMVKTVLDNPPKTKKVGAKKENVSSKVTVETMKLSPTIFKPEIQSHGLIDASIKTELISQASGKIVYINKNFTDGGSFKKGELLLRIEDSDYKADVAIAKSQVILMQQAYIEEKAKAQQAKEEWNNLNSNIKASDLVLRIPQLNSAKANLSSAKAQLNKAKIALNRTKIYAPYNGRVIKKNVDIAQVVNVNSVLANIYASNNVQIRLPIKNSDLKLINVKEKPSVTFFSKLSQNTYKGRVLRAESGIDTNSGQLYLIAKIDFDSDLQIGEYLTAKITGKTLEDSFIIPNSSIYQGEYVYIEKENIITRRDIESVWSDGKNTLVSKGLVKDENIVLTSLGLISSGTSVTVINKGDKK